MSSTDGPLDPGSSGSVHPQGPVSVLDHPRAQRPRIGRNRPTITVIAVVAALLIAAIIAWVIVLVPDATDGGTGVGDPYFPRMGGGGYDAEKYAIDVSWDDTHALLSGTTTMTARATKDLSAVHVDLALKVDRVSQGTTVTEYTQDGQDVRVKLAEPVRAGQEFALTLSYAGNPGLVSGDGGFYDTNGEIVVADEPSSAPLWFPSNDHPSDPALMDVTLRVPTGKQAVSVGRLDSHTTEGGRDVWHWVSSQPMATYLNFFAIGDFRIEQGVVDGRPYVYAVSNQLPNADELMTTLHDTAGIVKELENLYGPYPFTEIGGVAAGADFDFGGLEIQTRPLYQADALQADSRQLMVHELAHMWFGNNVTLRGWKDIFMNEAFATHAQWMVGEQAGDGPANDYLNGYYDQLPDDIWQLKISDPGPDDLFDEAVYVRGAMTMQALRNVMGDDAFLAMCREWAQRPGSRSLAEFRVFAQQHASTDLSGFFTAWVDTPAKPERTPQNGFIA